MSNPVETDPSARVELHYSPWMCAGATALFLWFAGWAGFWIVAALSRGHALAIVVGGMALLVVVPLLLPFASSILHPWRHRGPVLVLDSTGVTDVRKKIGFIPWSDVRSVSLGSGETAGFLCFSFRYPDAMREDAPKPRLLRRMAFLSDWNVSLRMLRCSNHEVLRSAQRLHRESLRRQVRHSNDSGAGDARGMG